MLTEGIKNPRIGSQNPRLPFVQQKKRLEHAKILWEDSQISNFRICSLLIHVQIQPKQQIIKCFACWLGAVKDFVNKIAFCLAIWASAKKDTFEKEGKSDALLLA